MRLNNIYKDLSKLNILTFMVFIFALLGNEVSIANSIKKKEFSSLASLLKIEEYTALDKDIYLNFTGNTGAYHAVDIFPEVEGKVENIFLKDGSQVKSGDIILEIEKNSKVEQFEQAKANLQQKESEYKAQKSLNKKGFTSEIQLLEFFVALKTAQTEFKKSKKNLEDTQIKSPFSGLIDKMNLQEGDFINPNLGKSITTVLNFDKLKTVIYVPEKYIDKIKLDMIAKITLRDGGLIEGKVDFISKIIDADTRTYKIEFSSDTKKENLTSLSHGMLTNVNVLTGVEKAHKIPSHALTLSDEGVIGVKLVDENSTISFVPIKIVDDNIEGVWITGIPEKVKLVVLGHNYVKDGDKI